jgi:hypothetical protein
MFQVAACIGIASTLRTTCHIPPNWSYREWFCLPEWLYNPAPDDVVAADETELVAHIDDRAKMYLQDQGLFRDVADLIRDCFHPSTAAIKVMGRSREWRWIRERNPVALHVRRGDTVTQPAGFQPLATMDYYNAAMEGFEGRPVMVFSDDPQWCRRQFSGRGWSFVNHGKGRSHRPGMYRKQPAMDWLDLQLMACCSNHVMSNSTYAWWSAFLSEDKEPRYPSVWWGENLSHIDTGLMVPGEPTWIEVPC